MSENHNDDSSVLNFPQSVNQNLDWIRRMAVQHNCSGGLAANAALMTMTMMDHHKMLLAITEIQKQVTEIKEILCRSNSLPAPSKESL